MKKHLHKPLAALLVLALLVSVAGGALAVRGTVTKNVDYADIGVTLNGKKLELKDANGKAVEPFAIDGTTYLPVRAISKALGLYVGWDQGTSQVTLSETPDVKNEFLVPESQAKTYINPLCLPDTKISPASDKGVLPENPFATGLMIANVIIPEHEAETHMRFQTMFRGTANYVAENDTRSTADPAGFYYKDTWYVYGSNGSMWSSKDFVNWTFHDLSYAYNMAPTIAVRTGEDGKDKFYLAGNSTELFVADDPAGPFTSLGAFTWNDAPLVPSNNDVNLFVDDDNRMYLYWGMGPGIYGAELDVKTPTNLITEPVKIIDFNPENEWERFGQHNQDWENGFPEGSWMVKIDGTYYLTWATSGTQYDSYGMGAYKSASGPLTGFQPQERPITNYSDALSGTVRGGGHGSIVEGPNGTLWCFYTVNIGYEGDMERRLGCDPVAMDVNGDLYVPHFSENPQYVPGVLSHPELGNEVGSVELTARQGYMVSSYSEGRHPIYAIDDSVLTWWQPEAGDQQPSLIVSLKGNYYVDSARVLWKEIGLDQANGVDVGAFQYKIEVYDGSKSQDSPVEGKGTWTTLVDKTSNTEDYIMDYYMADTPVYGQYVKLTITGWPKGVTPGVVEFTCFGESAAKPGAGK